MREHYVDKEDWRDRLLMWVTYAVMIPIAVVMRLIFGERK